MTFPVAWLPTDQASPRWTRVFGPPDSNVGDIQQALIGGPQAAGATGLVADAGHVHSVQANYAARMAGSAQSIPNNTLTALSFSTVGLNRGGLWNNSNPTRLTAVVAGIYLFVASIGFTQNASGTNRLLSLNKNGGVSLVIQNAFNGSVITYNTVVLLTEMTLNDYVEAYVLQDSGGSLSTSTIQYIAGTLVGL